MLVDRQGFTGERRLVRLQVRRLEETQVGGDALPGFEVKDVARHDLGPVHSPEYPVAQHSGRGPDHGAQGRRVALRLPLLHGADRRVDGQHKKDEGGVVELTQPQRHHRRPEEQIDQRAPELAENDGEDAPPPRLRQDVPAMLRQSPARFDRAQTRLVGAQPLQDMIHVSRMPHRLRRIAFSLFLLDASMPSVLACPGQQCA